MRLSVTPNKVEITEKGTINQGEYNVTKCHFDFTKAFDGLVKKVLFTNTATQKTYEVPVIDNSCDIPVDVLQTKGSCVLGVYAYDVTSDDKMMLRYSPTPTRITIDLGSYTENVENPSDVTISQTQRYEKAINDKISALDKSASDAKAKIDEVVTEIRTKLESGEFTGEKGEPGKNGENGKDGENGQDGRSAYEIAQESGFTGTQAEWLKSLEGKPGQDGRDGLPGKDGANGQDGAPGRDGADGKNGENGQDGFSPMVQLEQIDNITAKITVTNKNGTTSATFGGTFKDSEEEQY